MDLIKMSPTWSMEWRHHTEVKHLVKLRQSDREKALRYLEGIERKRGKAAAQKLREDAVKLLNGSVK